MFTLLVYLFYIQEFAPYAETARTELWGVKIKIDTLLVLCTPSRNGYSVAKLNNDILSTSQIVV